jgi:hypothetical protein
MDGLATPVFHTEIARSKPPGQTTLGRDSSLVICNKGKAIPFSSVMGSY